MLRAGKMLGLPTMPSLLKSLYRWVLAIADRARKDFDEEERFVFVNAWNEWGEGTYLEPDEKYGYAHQHGSQSAVPHAAE